MNDKKRNIFHSNKTSRSSSDAIQNEYEWLILNLNILLNFE